MCTGDDALQVTDPDAVTDGVDDTDDGVAVLVKSARDVDRGAIREMFAFHVEFAAPLAVPMTVESVVQPGAEMEARVGDGLDGDRPRAAVGHREMQRATQDAAVVVAHTQLGKTCGE